MLLKAQQNYLLPPSALPKGRDIWMYYNTSAQNEPVRWIKAVVEETTPHYVKCRRAEKGPTMTVEYKHVRLVTNDKLAEELQDSVLKYIPESDSSTQSSEEHPSSKRNV